MRELSGFADAGDDTRGLHRRMFLIDRRCRNCLTAVLPQGTFGTPTPPLDDFHASLEWHKLCARVSRDADRSVWSVNMRRMAGEEHVNRGTARSTKFTYDDFVHFPDDGKRHEIIDGEHYVTPSPNTKHQVVVGNLHLSIGDYLRERPIGFVFLAPFDVVFSHFDVVEPDLLYISGERMSVLTKAHVRGAPDLVVEILSPGTRRRDTLIKRRLYERFGVREYWIVDPERDVVKIHRRTGDAFGPALEVSSGRDEALTTPLLPGWSAPLRELLASPI
jgi:Uma2 family endonuclease